MLLIVGIGFVVNSLWANGNVLGDKSNLTSAYLLEQTNQSRAQEKQSPLALDNQLSAAAQAKAEDMAKKNYWAHNSPDGKTPWTFIGGSGYQYQSAGENLAYGFSNASGVIGGWMNSAEHRANILSNSYKHVGFGVATSPDFQGKGPQTIVVAEYAEPVDAVANISFTVPEATQDPASVKGDATELNAQSVSRIEAITGGQAAWSALLISALAGAALALFLVRHGRRLHRMIAQGERFVTHHPLLDIAAVFVFTAGFILTRTTGIIG